jgi:phytoene dehydrogenase-like protein
MEEKFGLDIRDSITVAKVNTPKDFAKMLRHPRGAVYGLCNDITCSAAFRPRVRSKAVKNLYLSGASTHLGGGVPTTIGSGVVAGDFILKDFG